MGKIDGMRRRRNPYYLILNAVHSVGWRVTQRNATIRKAVSVCLSTTHIGEGDLRRRPLLQEQFSGRFVENKGRERAVQYGTGLLFRKLVGFSLGRRSDYVVLVVQDKDRILHHHVLLGHGIAVPYSVLWCHRDCLLACLYRSFVRSGVRSGLMKFYD